MRLLLVNLIFLGLSATQTFAETCTTRVTANPVALTSQSVDKTLQKRQSMDVLWVIDESHSMESLQELLFKSSKEILDRLVQSNIDFNFAAVTSDGRVLLKGEGIDLLNAATYQADPNSFVKKFKSIVQVGAKGSNKEQLLDGIVKFLATDGVFFLRSKSVFMINILTNNDNSSGDSTSVGDQSSYSAETFLEKIQKYIKPDRVIFNVFLDRSKNKKFIEIQSAVRGGNFSLRDLTTFELANQFQNTLTENKTELRFPISKTIRISKTAQFVQNIRVFRGEQDVTSTIGQNKFRFEKDAIVLTLDHAEATPYTIEYETDCETSNVCEQYSGSYYPFISLNPAISNWIVTGLSDIFENFNFDKNQIPNFNEVQLVPYDGLNPNESKGNSSFLHNLNLKAYPSKRFYYPSTGANATLKDRFEIVRAFCSNAASGFRMDIDIKADDEFEMYVDDKKILPTLNEYKGQVILPFLKGVNVLRIRVKDDGGITFGLGLDGTISFPENSVKEIEINAENYRDLIQY